MYMYVIEKYMYYEIKLKNKVFKGNKAAPQLHRSGSSTISKIPQMKSETLEQIGN